MPDDQIAIGDMVWTVLEDDDETAPAPMCMASRAMMLTTWRADLEAYRARQRRLRRENSPEEIRRRADAIYDATAEHARANSMHMM
jgi:hypothetical protein